MARIQCRPAPAGAESKSLKALRLLFVAVAQGVVQHLQANSAAFSVTVNQASHSHAGGDHTLTGMVLTHMTADPTPMAQSLKSND